MYLLGVSQRVCLIPETGEKRDALAHDWGRFLQAVGVSWVTLPNRASEAVGMARQLGVSHLLLTGGDDWGVFPERDATEFALLETAGEANLPVVGICRGFQVMQLWLGGELSGVSTPLHRKARHRLTFRTGERRIVNSYHTRGITLAAAGVEPLAVCDTDNTVEAARRRNLLGIMWHPEREAVPSASDLRLLRSHYNLPDTV